MDILVYLLDALVLVALVIMMLYATKAIKVKNDPSVKKESLTKAVIAFVAYLILNALRMYAEGQLG